MTRKNIYQEMPTKKRAERVLEAKLAFSDNNSIENASPKHSFWLLRFMTAGMLFFVLLIAVYTGFSYHGFDREYIESCLSDGKYYDMFLKQIGKAITNIIAYVNID